MDVDTSGVSDSSVEEFPVFSSDLPTTDVHNHPNIPLLGSCSSSDEESESTSVMDSTVCGRLSCCFSLFDD